MIAVEGVSMAGMYGVENRIGEFCVSERVVMLAQKDPRMLEIIFRGLFIMRCEFEPWRLAYRYTALEIEPWGPRFAIVAVGQKNPEYKWEYADGAIEWTCAIPEKQIVKASG